MRPFFISIDTEGDDLWSWKPGDAVRTENAKWLERFQSLCNLYGFRPTYLTNWEMINDPRYAEFAREHVAKGECEIGMHLHAWNSPPLYQLAEGGGGAQDYLIEYAYDEMDEKIRVMTETIEGVIGIRPITHRAGRWAMDSRYFELLAKHGYLCDCSVTPRISWSSCPGYTAGSKGSDYSESIARVHFVDCGSSGRIVEIPLTTRKLSRIIPPDKLSLKAALRAFNRGVCGGVAQIRPNLKNFNEMKWLIENEAESVDGYLMFMLHSSELMPGGSPTFATRDSVEALYAQLRALFSLIRGKGYVGSTIGDYARSINLDSVPIISAKDV